MTNLTPKQEMLLRNVRAAKDAQQNAKRSAWERARKAVETELLAFDMKIDLEVRAAFEGKVPKARIGLEGLGTKNAKTVLDSLARTEAVAASVSSEVDPLASRYSWDEDSGELTVTLDGTDLEDACAAEDWTVTDAERLSFNVARFRVDGHALVPLSGDFLPEHGRRHPVTVWTLRNDTEARQWLAGRQKEAA